jgi:hypothetical protein
MSRTWTRSALVTCCGNCKEVIPKDCAIQVIAVPGVNRSMIRCPVCADSPAPEDLPALPAPSMFIAPSFVSAGTLAADYKLAQANDDDWEDLL